MPTSHADAIPLVIKLVQQLRPLSILDVGIGYGKWGVLFREYLDVWFGWKEGRRYGENRVTIQGIEIYTDYRSPAWNVYDSVNIGDALGIVRMWTDMGIGVDLVFAGDVLEHFACPAVDVVHAFRGVSRHQLFVVPARVRGQGTVYGNAHERHYPKVWDWQNWGTGDFQAQQVGRSLVIWNW